MLLKGKKQIFLAIDKIPVMEVAVNEGPLALLTTHFVFNIQYPVGLKPVFTFLEFIYLNKKPSKQGVVFLLFMLNVYCFETVIIAMRQAVPKNWSIYVVDLIHQKVVFSTHHAAVVGLIHHKVVVSQERAEPTTFGGLNPPPFLQWYTAT